MKKLELGWSEKWGNKETTILWAPYTNRILDYSNEVERKQIHRECGGKLTYVSFSGKTGCGYLKKLGALVPVGYYNLKNGTLHSEDVDAGVKVMIPYDNMAVDAGYPFVVVKYDKVVYCRQKDLPQILKDILRGDWANEPTKVYKKKLYSTSALCSHVVKLTLYNFFGTSKRMPSPWQFAEDLLKSYLVGDQSYLEAKLKVARVGNQIVRTKKIGTFICAKEPIQSDPLVSDDQLLEILKNSSWEVGVGPCDCIYKLGDKEVEVIVWSKPQLWQKKVLRKAETLPKEKKDVFVKEAEKNMKSVYANSVYNKALFLLDIDRCQGVTRKMMVERVDEILDSIINSIE